MKRDENLKNDEGSVFVTAQQNEDIFKKRAAWFLGARGENSEFLSELINDSIQAHVDQRENNSDFSFITDELKSSENYRSEVARIKKYLEDLSAQLRDSVPFYSNHYQAHMNWDIALPGIAGYFAAMLYNQNNVATESSPVTSRLEYEAGVDLCGLLGFGTTKDASDLTKEWGHITADGTIANIEAAWVARNIKLLPVSIKECIISNPKLIKAQQNLFVNITGAPPVQGRYVVVEQQKRIAECTLWQLLNLSCDEAALLPVKVQEICEITSNEFSEMLSPFLVRFTGLSGFYKRYPGLKEMKLVVPATKHYSWIKAATLLGFGQSNLEVIPVDESCRMDVCALDERLRFFSENEIPVMMVVASVGSTGEGAIDPIDKIAGLRATIPINFLLHCDAAWGGYLRTMLIDASGTICNAFSKGSNLLMSDYVRQQYLSLPLADTVTIDPHKGGFIPYPSGGLCYRNGALRCTISLDASYIHSDDETNMGKYGIEGSKPGAAAAAVWLTHKVIPLNSNGYGHILGECNFISKLYYCYWIALAQDNDEFILEPLINIPDKIFNSKGDLIIANIAGFKQFINDNIIGKTRSEIATNSDVMDVLKEIGSDALINSFVVNFKLPDGKLNPDIERCRKLNQMLFEKFSVSNVANKDSNKADFIITKSELSTKYHKSLLKNICKRTGLQEKENFSLYFIINTILQGDMYSAGETAHFTGIFRNGIKECVRILQATYNNNEEI